MSEANLIIFSKMLLKNTIGSQNASPNSKLLNTKN